MSPLNYSRGGRSQIRRRLGLSCRPSMADELHPRFTLKPKAAANSAVATEIEREHFQDYRLG
jgi:hypothetical protein